VLTTGLDIFKRLEGERREPVDARVFIEELMKATGISREEAERALANMVKSGMVFEAAPGKYRRI
jgi:DNA-binding IclR family transcriptional regulator